MHHLYCAEGSPLNSGASKTGMAGQRSTNEQHLMHAGVGRTPGIARAPEGTVLHKEQQHGGHGECLAAQVQYRLRCHCLGWREPCARPEEGLRAARPKLCRGTQRQPVRQAWRKPCSAGAALSELPQPLSAITLCKAPSYNYILGRVKQACGSNHPEHNRVCQAGEQSMTSHPKGTLAGC